MFSSDKMVADAARKRKESKPLVPLLSEGRTIKEAGVKILKYKGFAPPKEGAKKTHSYRIWYLCCHYEADMSQRQIQVRGEKRIVKCPRCCKRSLVTAKTVVSNEVNDFLYSKWVSG